MAAKGGSHESAIAGGCDGVWWWRRESNPRSVVSIETFDVPSCATDSLPEVYTQPLTMVYDRRMAEDSEEKIEDEIEESQEPQAHGGSLKRKNNLTNEKKLAFGRMWFGESFEGFQKVADLRPNLPAFKEFYYTKKVQDTTLSSRQILIEFNETIAPDKFHPYPNQLKFWTAKWDKNILEQMGYKTEKGLIVKGDVYQHIKTRAQDQSLAYGTPEDETLEAATRTLGGELVNDALSMLRNDQELEEIYDSDELIRRRTYVVNVFAHVTRSVHKKAELMLKASQEKRETAGFLMDLMRSAAAGKLTQEQIDLMKSSTVSVTVTPANDPAHTG